MAQIARTVQKWPESSGEGAVGRGRPYSAIAREATVVNPASSKYTRGQYALCPNCLQRPCQCAPAAPAPALAPNAGVLVPLCPDCGFKPCRCAAAAPGPIGEVSNGQAPAKSPARSPAPANVVLMDSYYKPDHEALYPFEVIREWGKLGLSLPALAVATYVWSETIGNWKWGPVSMSERSIAAALGKSRGEIVNALNELEQKGRLQRIIRPGYTAQVRLILLEEERKRQQAKTGPEVDLYRSTQ